VKEWKTGFGESRDSQLRAGMIQTLSSLQLRMSKAEAQVKVGSIGMEAWNVAMEGGKTDPEGRKEAS